jgi:hypothetical protein
MPEAEQGPDFQGSKTLDSKPAIGSVVAMILFKLVFIVGLIRLLLATNNPVMCTSIYGTGHAILGSVLCLTINASLLPVLAMSSIAFVLALVYFWLLDRFEETMFFWLIMIGGLILGLV